MSDKPHLTRHASALQLRFCTPVVGFAHARGCIINHIIRENVHCGRPRVLAFTPFVLHQGRYVVGVQNQIEARHTSVIITIAFAMMHCADAYLSIFDRPTLREKAAFQAIYSAIRYRKPERGAAQRLAPDSLSGVRMKHAF